MQTEEALGLERVIYLHNYIGEEFVVVKRSLAYLPRILNVC